MESSNFVKTAAAFVAGLVVALASVLIYVKIHQGGGATPTAQMASAAPVHGAAAPQPSVLPDAGGDGGTAAPAVNAKADPKSDSSQPASLPSVRKPRVQQPDVLPRRAATAVADEPSSAELAQTNPTLTQDPAAGPVLPQLQEEPAVIAPTPAPAREPRTVTIQAGTALSIRLSQKLSTEQNYSGDSFRGTLEQPIVLEGAIIAERGSQVTGKIVNADKAGRAQGVADLTLTLTGINTTDGQHVTIETSQVDRKGAKSTGSDAAKIAGGTALGAIIGAIAGGGKGAAIGAGAGGAAGTGTVLATRGKAAVFPIESRVDFRLATPVTITEHLNF